MSIPNFIIIGTQRGGTTSLFNYIRQNLTVRINNKKEIHYFDKNYDRSYQWYVNKLSNGFSGEATPYYLFHPLVPRRIKDFENKVGSPGIKFIVLLRKPSERAISHFYHEREIGNEAINSPDKAFKKEPLRLDLSEYRKVYNGKQSFEHQEHSYLSRGKYHKQLNRWFKYFNKDRFLIIKSEKFFANPKTVYSGVCDFLGIGDSKSGGFEVFNPTTTDNKDHSKLVSQLDKYYDKYGDYMNVK